MTPRGYEIATAGPALVDTSVLIDLLRGDPAAGTLLELERRRAPLHSSEIVRLELLAGVRDREAEATEAVLGVITWHSVDEEIARLAGAMGRAWLPSHTGIDSADLAIAATTVVLGGRLLTRNIRHFPMLTGLRQPY